MAWDVGLVLRELRFQKFSESCQLFFPSQADSRVSFPEDFAVGADEVGGRPTGDAVVVVVAVVFVPESGVFQFPGVPVLLRLLVSSELAAGDLYDDEAPFAVFCFPPDKVMSE